MLPFCEHFNFSQAPDFHVQKLIVNYCFPLEESIKKTKCTVPIKQLRLDVEDPNTYTTCVF